MPTGLCKLQGWNGKGKWDYLWSFLTNEFFNFCHINIISKKLKSESDDKLQIGNSIYSIRFERRDRFDKFGSKYWFHLEDAIDDCPEYLVHFPTFQK